MELKGKIVFSSGKSGDYDIWLLDLTGKKISQLTTGSFLNDCPKWSPDGKKIIFISNRTGTPEIWMMDESGGNQTRITDTGRWHDTPDWSPDGKNLVFCANYDGNINIYTYNFDGSVLKQITKHKEMDHSPQYSPDGKEIIFTSRRSGNEDIWTYNTATKELKQITTYKGRDYSPVYSPDGNSIAFLSTELTDPENENLEVFIMDKDGGNKTRVTNNLGSDRYVRWSPDGKFLIYTASKPNSTAERLMIASIENREIVTLDINRDALEYEIDAKARAYGLFRLLPETLIRKTYSDIYFGTERSPDWKY